MATTLADITTKLDYYLAASVPSTNSLDALNEARKYAERLHAFELNKKVLELSSVVGSVDWTSAKKVGTNTTYSTRNVKKLWKRATNGGLTEIPVEYKSLIDMANVVDETACIVGTDLYVLPANTVAYTLQMDAYVWMADYTTIAATDWMITHGASFLFWKALQLLNHKFKEFVPRQEGNLAVSDNYVEAQLEALISLDNQIKNGFYNQLP